MNVADRQRPAPGELYLDHLAHFVADLDAAARVFESLGMKVTPLSVHQTTSGPVGTSNRCVMFEEGYLELLSPTHDTPAARWARFAALVPRPEGDGVRLETARGRIFIGTRETLVKLLGEAPPAPAIAGYSLRSSHPEKLAARCTAAGISVRKNGARYAAKLPAALGGHLVF